MRRQDLQAYAFLAPALLLLLALLVYPLAQVVRMSFHEISVRQERWVGLDNYAALLGSPAFWQSLAQTVAFTVGSVALHLLIGLGLALLLHARIQPRLRSLFRGLLIVPWLFAPVVAGMIWGSKLGVQFSLATVALRALPVVILGGLTSVPGAIIGGLIIGVGEKLSEVYIGPMVGGGIEIWFAYVLALGFLLFRPQGLFGEKIIDRV